MKDRTLMTSFVIGHSVDSVMSASLLPLDGWQEKGFMADSGFLTGGEMDKIIIAKMGVVALLVGAYALAKETKEIKGVKLGYTFEKTLQFGNIAVWAVTVWNLLNVAATLMDK